MLWNCLELQRGQVKKSKKKRNTDEILRACGFPKNETKPKVGSIRI